MPSCVVALSETLRGVLGSGENRAKKYREHFCMSNCSAVRALTDTQMGLILYPRPLTQEGIK